MPPIADNSTATRSSKTRRWRRRLLCFAILALGLLIVAAYVTRHEVKTLRSLRRVGDSNVYVLDYYGDYNLQSIRDDGMDCENLEDSFINTLFPEPVATIAVGVKRWFVPSEVNSVAMSGHHCSTLTMRTADGEVYFGRNFDWPHDACLIVRIHDKDGLASIAVIDLHYLNLDREDLEQASFVERIPLLFAPYYVMDGMNRHGVAISDMSVERVEAPRHPGKPDVASSTMMRLILDYAKTTEEAITLIHNYNVTFPHAEVHFMVCDAQGDSRVVEFIDGNIRVTPAVNEWQICTNSVVWNRTEEQRDADCSRYAKGSDRSQQDLTALSPTAAIDAIREMSVEDYTMWTSLYELRSGRLDLHFKASPNVTYQDSFSQ